ncbi:MAG: hypothetical protein AAFW89_02895 [Bacteroidota bacterium]
MNNSTKLTVFLLCVAIIGYGCDGQEGSLINERLEDNPLPITEMSPGTADFSNYVSLGNSLTAGYMDGALYTSGQALSIPALLANQLNEVGGTEGFNQPDINSVDGFNTGVTPNPANNITLGRFKLDTGARIPSPTINGELPSLFTGDKTTLQNFGVPGIITGQMLTGATGGPAQGNPAFNALYARFASNPGTSTILGDAIAAQPSFFSLWIGNNDVLGYAVSGASDENLLTDPAIFDQQYEAIIAQLIGNTTADGIVVNIPPFLGLAYFRAVPFQAIPVTRQTQADSINGGYAAYNAGLQAAFTNGAITEAEATRRTITFSLGVNAFVIEDESLTDLSGLGLPSIRQSEQTDLFVLALGSILGTDLGAGVVGVQAAVADQFVLLPSEQQQIEVARAAFNATIAQAVTDNSERLVLYDTNGFVAEGVSSAFLDIFGLSDGVPGVVVNRVELTPDFTPTGVISTDGIHPNPRGNGLIVNDMIQVIEGKFGATIPKVDVLDLPSVTVCAGDCVSQQQ